MKLIFCIIPLLLWACSPADLAKETLGINTPNTEQIKPINIEIAGPKITINNYYENKKEDNVNEDDCIEVDENGDIILC